MDALGHCLGIKQLDAARALVALFTMNSFIA
jgi:hypothetical protein